MYIVQARTVEELLKEIFPDGTRPNQIDATWDLCPLLPWDVFAAAATLMRRSGIYSEVVPCSHSSPCQICTTGVLAVSAQDRAGWISLGERWDALNDVDALGDLQEIWDDVWRARDQPIYRQISYADVSSLDVPTWWRAALSLMIVSDIASNHHGWQNPNRAWFEDFLVAHFFNLREDSGTRGRLFNPPSMAVMADPDAVCVQPKSKTPGVGLGLRTLSHNLCLLPPRGEVSTSWLFPLKPYRLLDESAGPLNILFVPMPFEIQDNCWSSEDGWFDLEQRWLKYTNGSLKTEQIVDFVKAALQQALVQLQYGMEIHGLVFPEYALNMEVFGALVEQVRSDGKLWQSIPADDRKIGTSYRFPFRSIEFLVAGSSDYQGKSGNFVLQALLLKKEGSDEPEFLVTGRSKHHRWMLNRSQLETYALSQVLPLGGHSYLAERIKVRPREIQTFVFRQGSCFTAMICEDLARSDPCLDVLRDLGPNIVFVLLMDGPQTPSRWSARYAQALSDDPGCAVLNLTSLALIERTNGTGLFPRSRSVGLFRGSSGRTHEINCPDGCHAVVISLRGEGVDERSLDGRVYERCIDWKFERYVPIRVYDSAARKAFFGPN